MSLRKRELLDRQSFRTHARARAITFEYLEGWYNPHRRHSAIGYLSCGAAERDHLHEHAADDPADLCLF